MAKRVFSAEEAYEILAADGSNGERSDSESSAYSDESDVDYEPVISSGSVTEETETAEEEEEEEEEEEGPPARRRRSAEEAVPSTSTAVPSTSTAVPREARPRTSGVSPQPQRVRSHASLPYSLQYPLWLPPNSGEANIPPFTAQPGVQVDTENFSPIDFFNLIFTNDMLATIVAQCNLYAQQFITSNPTSSYARPYVWKALTVEEFRIFLGLTFCIGLNGKNQLRSYWSSRPIYHMPIFSSVMPRSRYLMIMRFLHFNDNTQCPPRNDPNFDKLYKIRPLLNYFSETFPQLFTPDKHICIDESLIKFSGRLGIKQFIPSKRARYGVKLYKLCDRETGYVYGFIIYEGKDSELNPPNCPIYIGTSGKVVWELINPLLEKGYHLYVDNFYTSLPLFRNLHRMKTPACGTVRTNRKGFPQSLVTKKLRRGETASLRNEEILAVKWRDRRDVYLLSSIHNNEFVEVTRRNGRIQKPKCIYDYNKFMGGVDFNDQMLEPYLSTRRSYQWYKKVSIYLFNLAMYNSYVIYRKSTRRPKSFLFFQEEITTALLYPNSPPVNIRSDVVSRLSERHFPDKIPPRPTGQKRQKKCRVCSKRGERRDTIYHCAQCPSEPGLCIGNCFRHYHTKINY